MTPLSPEAVAQMAADREAAYQSYLNEITTNGNSRLDNIILSLSGNEVQQRHIATQIDMAFQAGWHHMLTSLAAENATLRAERDEARTWLGAANNEFGSAAWNWPDLWRRIAQLKELSNSRWQSLNAAEAELATLRASEAAAVERVTRLEAALNGCIAAIEHADMADGVCCCGDNMDGHSEPMNCGHSPVDMGEYHAHQVLTAARQALTPTADKEPKP